MSIVPSLDGLHEGRFYISNMQEAPKLEKTATKALQAQQQKEAITSATAKIRAQLHQVTIQSRWSHNIFYIVKHELSYLGSLWAYPKIFSALFAVTKEG